MSYKTLDELKSIGEAPEWMEEESYKMLMGTYLLPNETPKGMWWRVSNSSAKYLNKPEMAQEFFNLFWKNWVGLATPVAANSGTERALNISCFSISINDSIDGIMSSMHELAMMTKNGGGVGVHWNDVRPRGSIIKGNGKSEGVIPFIKIQDSTTIGVSQGGVRRGASAAYLPVDHGDFWEFIRMRRPEGDANRQCLNTHQGVCITDDFMNRVKNGDKEAREKWVEILKSRFETGEPYLFFSDNVSRNRPDTYKNLSLDVKGSNICCVSGDTLIATKNGPKQIKDLVGKSVEIWDGLNWVLNDTFEQRGEDKLIRVKISDGTYVDCNSNHRWFVASSYEDIRNNKYTETLTKDLNVGQWIENHSQEIHGNTNVEGAYFKGFLLGDGTHVKDRPLLRLHSSKYSCEEKLVLSAKEITAEEGKTNSIDEVSFSEEYNYTNSNQNTFGKQELKNMKGLSVRKNSLINWTTTYKKSLPPEIFNWNKNSKLEFLAGLFDADGTLGARYSLQIASIHEKFILDLQMFLKTFGFSSTIDVLNKKSIDKNKLYRLCLSSYDAFNLINQMPTQRIKPKQEEKEPNRKTTGWRKIVSIENLEGVHPVFCPNLPTTGKFGLANGLMTGNTEIFLHTDKDHSFVCCLSSLNLARWDEWKNTNAVELTVWFLDGILSEFIDKASRIPGFEKAVRSAVKGRSLGAGVFGLHTYFQEHNISFDSFDAFMVNAQMFSGMRKQADKATQDLAKEYGEPEWCKGSGRRNTHTIALAPTVSNSLISGNVSPSIEPWAANAFVQKSAKGSIIQKNKTLVKLLESKVKNTDDVWKSIIINEGSVQHLDFLNKEEKEVFLTAREINQFTIIKLAGQRQKWIDQGQSLNIFFPANADPKYVHEVHMMAHEEGLNSLYYLRSSSVLKGDSGSREYKRESTECKACEG